MKRKKHKSTIQLIFLQLLRCQWMLHPYNKVVTYSTNWKASGSFAAHSGMNWNQKKKKKKGMVLYDACEFFLHILVANSLYMTIFSIFYNCLLQKMNIFCGTIMFSLYAMPVTCNSCSSISVIPAWRIRVLKATRIKGQLLKEQYLTGVILLSYGMWSRKDKDSQFPWLAFLWSTNHQRFVQWSEDSTESQIPIVSENVLLEVQSIKYQWEQKVFH